MKKKIKQLSKLYLFKLAAIEYHEYEQLGKDEEPPETVRTPDLGRYRSSPNISVKEELASDRDPDDRVTTFRDYGPYTQRSDVDSGAPTERGVDFTLTDEDLGLINLSLHYLRKFWMSGDDPEESNQQIERINDLLRKVRALKHLY